MDEEQMKVQRPRGAAGLVAVLITVVGVARAGWNGLWYAVVGLAIVGVLVLWPSRRAGRRAPEPLRYDASQRRRDPLVELAREHLAGAGHDLAAAHSGGDADRVRQVAGEIGDLTGQIEGQLVSVDDGAVGAERDRLGEDLTAIRTAVAQVRASAGRPATVRELVDRCPGVGPPR
ncbi:MAG: hypothetical protein H0U62_08755 [Actinobacteria bacterium]|nr:hypothetical protein [Actinomycetota bacterium]